MTSSLLDEKYTLDDLLDLVVLEELIQAYSQCFNLGVSLISEEGEEKIDVCPPHSFCSEVQKGSNRDKCISVKKHIMRHQMEGSKVLTIKAFCGVQYSLLPLTHQFEVLGRVIVGPFRSTGVDPVTIAGMAQTADNPISTKQAETLPAYPPERIKEVVRLLAKILDTYVFINAKRLITTRIHVEELFSNREKIFRQVELQDSGTAQDKEEIEKLKNMF